MPPHTTSTEDTATRVSILHARRHCTTHSATGLGPSLGNNGSNTAVRAVAGSYITRCGGRGHGNSNGQVHRKSSEAPDAPARLGHPSPHTRHWKSLRHLALHLPGDQLRHHDQRRQRRRLWQPTASLDGGIQQNNTEQSCLQCQPGLDHCHHHHHHHHHRAALATACERPRRQCWYLRRLYM